MKKIIILTILIILIPLNINAYELETENGEYEYSKTIPENGYDYSHAICNGTKIKNEDVTYNKETKTFVVSGVIEQSSCKFYFNKNGEEIIKNYEVKVTVLNGIIEGDTTKIIKQNTNATFTFNPSSGYGDPMVSCTNSQTGTMNGNTLTVSNVTNDTTCTVTYKELTGAETIISKATSNNTEGLIKLDQPATEQTEAGTEYRYSGSNDVVKNYVNFNNETWRIIGVFPTDDGTGNIENRIKIIREEAIGSYSWDTSKYLYLPNPDGGDSSTIVPGSGRGASQWGKSGSYEGADLMRLLNPGYENENINNSLYWNRESGTCYNSNNNAITSCNFTNIGLTEQAKQMIEDALWYTVAGDFSLSADDAFAEERLLTTPQLSVVGVSTTRTINWTGKIGLIYASDYGYASSECRNSNVVLEYYGNSTCTSTNWLFNGTSYYMLIPFYSYGYYVLSVNTSGDVYNAFTSLSSSVRPSLYLSSSVKITSGTGTIDDMYELSL